jgi:hypothetical protein
MMEKKINMHIKQMSESDGKFIGREYKSKKPCPKCNRESIVYRLWESNCGGYEDVKYYCKEIDCECFWWTEGPDA